VAEPTSPPVSSSSFWVGLCVALTREAVATGDHHRPGARPDGRVGRAAPRGLDDRAAVTAEGVADVPDAAGSVARSPPRGPGRRCVAGHADHVAPAQVQRPGKLLVCGVLRDGHGPVLGSRPLRTLSLWIWPLGEAA